MDTQDLALEPDSKFTAAEMTVILNAATQLATAMGGMAIFREELGGVAILQDNKMKQGGLAFKNKVLLNTISSGWDVWRVTHELAHAWDANHGWNLSNELKQKTGGRFSLSGVVGYWFKRCDPTQPGCNHWGYAYGGQPPKGADGGFDQREDFAESVTAYIYPDQAKQFIARVYPTVTHFQYDDYRATDRGRFIKELLGRVAGRRRPGTNE